MEIGSDLNSNFTVQGPKILLLDYSKINNDKSFAIESNKTFPIFEQEIEYKIHMSKKEYTWVFISKQNDKKSLLSKRGFIYLNSEDSWKFVFKKFNFSIIESDVSEPGHEFISLCQGEEPKTELYYYKSNDDLIEFFKPVYGNFDFSISVEKYIKTISNFDFNYEDSFIPKDQKSYLKFVCKEPTLIKHSYIEDFYDYDTLNSGKRYYVSIGSFGREFQFSSSIKAKTISLKFSIIGAKSNYKVNLDLNGTEYILGNKSLDFELNKTNQKFLIKLRKLIRKEVIVEIIVGTKEDLNNFEIKDLNESPGDFSLKGRKAGIVKVPRDYDANFYNFLIIQNQPNYKYRYLFEISYDKIEFLFLDFKLEKINEFSQIVPFYVNPYSYIPNNSEKSDEKYFYILLYIYGPFDFHLLIKRPKLFSDIKLNKIISFPKAEEENKGCYYKIPLPNGNYSSLLIQTNANYSNYFSLSINNTTYPLYSFLSTDLYALYKIPIDKKDNGNIHLNYYGNSFSDGFLNFIPINESNITQFDSYLSLI